jgi:prepilin-type N-terminal cleavage/methylation domain-containing protein
MQVGCVMSRLRVARPRVACSASGRHAPGHPENGDAGFTLVEVIVAMGIFLIVTAATLGLIMTSLTTVRGNADRVYAAALARGEVDNLRTLGSAAIPLGATTRTTATDAGTFTITRTATWVDIGAPTNPCQVGPGVAPGKSYLRVQVEVVGEDLEAAQHVDAIVYPKDTPTTQNTGTITVAVNDDQGEPVSGVLVAGTNGSGGTFQQTTGPDGCVFVPDLVISPPNWSVTVSKSGYITEQLNAQTQQKAVAELQNTPFTYTFDASGSITFTAGSGGFPVPDGMPFTFSPDTRNRQPSSFSTYPVAVNGLWPDQYTGWLRPCVGAGEGNYATTDLAAGSTATLDLGGTRVELVGPKTASVVVKYATTGRLCNVTYTLGGWNASLLKKTSLPAGTWTFEVTGATPLTRTVVLSQGLGLCSVSFNVPDAVTQAEADELLADPEYVPPPDGLVILPEVSEPCPTS